MDKTLWLTVLGHPAVFDDISISTRIAIRLL